MVRHGKKMMCILMILITVIAAVLTGCQKEVRILDEPLTKTEFVLGTICTLKVYDDVSADVLDRGFARLSEIEKRMTINAEGSEVDEVNANAGVKPVKVTDDVYYVIKTGKEFGDISGGLFDISIGPIVKLWNIGTDQARVPAPEEITAKLPLVNYRDIELNESDKTVFLKKKGMIIDLGGIAKGYAADEVAKIFKENGVKHAIINLGGNILAMGNNPTQKRDWNIGVQNPFSERGEYIGILHVTDKTIVSSGVYERYFEQNGKRYHHILDPRNGYPVDNGLYGTTIVADKSIMADGLSTTVFANGIEKGLEIAEKQKVQAIFITKDKKVYITPGLKDNFKLTDSSFKLMN